MPYKNYTSIILVIHKKQYEQWLILHTINIERNNTYFKI